MHAIRHSNTKVAYVYVNHVSRMLFMSDLLLVINVQHVLRMPNEQPLYSAQHEFSQFGELRFWQLVEVLEAQQFGCAANILGLIHHGLHKPGSRLLYCVHPTHTLSPSACAIIIPCCVRDTCFERIPTFAFLCNVHEQTPDLGRPHHHCLYFSFSHVTVSRHAVWDQVLDRCVQLHHKHMIAYTYNAPTSIHMWMYVMYCLQGIKHNSTAIYGCNEQSACHHDSIQ